MCLFSKIAKSVTSVHPSVLYSTYNINNEICWVCAVDLGVVIFYPGMVWLCARPGGGGIIGCDLR